MRVWVQVVLILIVAGMAAIFMSRRPRYVVAASVVVGRDSMRVYTERINELQARLDTTRAVLVRRGGLDRLTVRLRTNQLEEELAQLRAAFQVWRDAHDQYGMGQSYRQCLLLYGSARASCQALAYDTLPPQSDTIASTR
jgi:hypothetical protein